MPIVGSFAGASARAYGASAGVLVGDFESIQTITVGAGGAATIEFTSIPATYTHLQLRLFTRTNRADAGIDDMRIKFNSDSGANYSIHGLYEFSGVYSFGSSNTNYLVAQGASGTNLVTSVFGIAIFDLLDYANTNKFKTARILCGSDSNYANSGQFGFLALNSGNWRNTAAVTTITLTPASGTAYVQYSHAALYGVKA